MAADEDLEQCDEAEAAKIELGGMLLTIIDSSSTTWSTQIGKMSLDLKIYFQPPRTKKRASNGGFTIRSKTMECLMLRDGEICFMVDLSDGWNIQTLQP